MEGRRKTNSNRLSANGGHPQWIERNHVRHAALRHADRGRAACRHDPAGACDDYGWNQSHAAAKDILRQVPGVTVVVGENVPKANVVTQTMKSMINLEGANLILANSVGLYAPFAVETAAKYLAGQFRHCAPLWNRETYPKNADSNFSDLNQAHYVNGVAAGLFSASGKLGYLAAKPVQTVLSNCNSFLLSARSVNANAKAQVIITGEWSMPVHEAAATNALIDAGCAVIGRHVDSPKVVIEAAESRGIKTCGHNADCPPLAPKGFITGGKANRKPSTRSMPPLSPPVRRRRTRSRAAIVMTCCATLHSVPAPHLGANRRDRDAEGGHPDLCRRAQG